MRAIIDISAERQRHLRRSRELNIELAEAHAYVKAHKPAKPDRDLRIISHMEGTTGKIGHRLETVAAEVGLGYTSAANVWYNYLRKQKVLRAQKIKDFVNRDRNIVTA